MAGPQRTLHERYELRSEVGRGGMGRVWRAHDTRLNRTVAVKELLLGTGLDEIERTRLTARARREAQATAMGQHPNIVTVHDIIEEDGRPWIVMEFLEGESLHRLVRDQGPLDAKRAAAWGLNLLDALETAHAQGITHRDVKPENVMVTDAGRVVLTDFGIATIADTTAITQTAGVMGSPAYLAPERLASTPASPAGDLWSLGATLYHAATGLSPFQREAIAATLHAVLNSEPPRELPGPLGRAVHAMLVKNPEHRLDAAGCRALLEAAARGDQTSPKAQEPQNTGMTPPATGQSTPATGTPTAVMGTTHSHPGPAAHPRPVPTAVTIPQAETPSGPYDAPSYPGGSSPDLATGGVTAPVPAPRGRRLSWPVVVLTLGLATLVVVATLVVLGPWQDGEQNAEAGTAALGEQETGSGTTTEAEATPSTEPEVEIETDAEGTPTGPGMTWTQDPEGFALLVPNGWVRRVQDQSVYYDSPTDDSYLQIDRTPHPTDDQYAHVLEQEKAPNSARRLPGYERVRVEDVTARTPFPSAADWEFVWTQNGVSRHLWARNITAADGDHYTLAFASNAENREQHTDLREHAIVSFDPF